MTATTDLGSDLGFGLSDTDFGAGLVTLVAALGHDPRDLQEAALVETVGVLDACVRWVQSEIAVRVAELARRRGGAAGGPAAPAPPSVANRTT